MKRIMIACVALAAFAAPAFAAQPNGSLVWNPATPTPNGSPQGGSSAIIQNGQFISGNCLPECDPTNTNPYIGQTSEPGQRAGLVQDTLGHPGLPNGK